MTAVRNPLRKLFSSPGTLLVIVTVFSLCLANIPGSESYRNFWHLETGLSSGNFHLQKSILHWVNDGLMVLFFLLVGLEIKREILEGELSAIKKAMLPVFAAAGGMFVPAIIFLLFNYGKPAMHGWGIPMATDIAFALAVLSMLKSSVPASIRIFLTALAIIDDLGAVLVIAFFYTDNLIIDYLMYAAGIVILLFIMNRTGISNLMMYMLAGIFLWYFILKSGVHATIAGVLLAVFIPVKKHNTISPLHQLEHRLTPVTQYFILPVFAMANTAILLKASLFAALLTAPAVGIFLGLVIGKPAGITLFSWLAVKNNIADLPRNVRMNQIAGAGMLGGIGFTMSIFISMLAFDDAALQDLAKISILFASLTAGCLGLWWMKSAGLRKA
jgi:Na+:H+ antiporter, NhaA family